MKKKKMNISENLVYAGGCALNSLANKKLKSQKFLIIYSFHTLLVMVVDQLVLL